MGGRGGQLSANFGHMYNSHICFKKVKKGKGGTQSVNFKENNVYFKTLIFLQHFKFFPCFSGHPKIPFSINIMSIGEIKK
jgi:hypothetical protein